MIVEQFQGNYLNAIIAIRKNIVLNLGVNPPVDRVTFYTLTLCYKFKPFHTHWNKRQKRTVKCYVNVIRFYSDGFNKLDQNVLREMIDQNTSLLN